MTTRRTTRTAAGTALAAALACTLVAWGLAPAPAGAGLPEQDRSATVPVPTTATVTVDQLGAGSVLAVVSHGNFEELSAKGLARSLEVITPDGVRHPVYSVQVVESRLGWHHGDFTLADWRPDLHTALLSVSLGSRGFKAVAYDVVTGATREVRLPEKASTIGLAPDGSGIIMTTYPTQRRSGRVVRQLWSGATSGITGRSDGAALTSPDGRTLVTNEGAARRWWIIDPVARTSSSVDTPGDCRPQRWADADSVVATCSRRMTSQLRLVHLDGTSSPLGIRHTERTRRRGAPIFDDEDVRIVRGTSWYESYGGCGGGVLTRQTAVGTARLVRVPGRDGALTLVGTRGDDLLVALQRTECGSWPDRAVLSTFDPVSRTETVLTRLGRTESWREVVSATEVRSWIW
jgi:hypothetical protein